MQVCRCPRTANRASHTPPGSRPWLGCCEGGGGWGGGAAVCFFLTLTLLSASNRNQRHRQIQLWQLAQSCWHCSLQMDSKYGSHRHHCHHCQHRQHYRHHQHCHWHRHRQHHHHDSFNLTTLILIIIIIIIIIVVKQLQSYQSPATALSPTSKHQILTDINKDSPPTTSSSENFNHITSISGSMLALLASNHHYKNYQ